MITDSCCVGNVISQVKTIVHNDIEHIFLNKRKKDRIMYTLYHELGHFSKAIKEDFSLVYMRIGNRIIYYRQGGYFTLKVKNKNLKAGGCTIIRDNIKEDSISSQVNRLRSVILAGGEVTESVLDLFDLSLTVSRKILELYPIPYSEYNPEFLKRSTVIGTDPWLYMSLKTNPELSKELFDCYERIAQYIDTGKEDYLKNCGFLNEEIPNIQLIHQKKGESLEQVYEKNVNKIWFHNS